jgi:lipoprotein-releasing system permease protein
MGFESFICCRYLKARRKQGFISLISLISISGVALGVTALIVVLAVMTGFTEELRNKILGVNSHIIVQRLTGSISDYQRLLPVILAREGVVGATPYIYAQTMISSGANNTGVVLRGIDPQTASSVLSLSGQMQSGTLLDLQSDPDQHHRPGIVIGKQLARKLRVGCHDKIRLLASSGPLTPMGVIPKILTCEVVGIFDTGMYEYDSSLAYVSLTTARNFLKMGDEVHGLELKISDIYQAGEIASALMAALGPGYVAKDWMMMNKNLFSALKLEKTGMFIALVLIVLVAAFNIISTLIMVVMEKTKDIAILKSMGATSKSIMRIFIYEGLIIGFTGTFFGVGGGLGICKLLSRYHFIKLPSDVYPMTTLPVKILPLDVTLIAVSAVLITFLATLYPSWQAARVDPAEALRY